MHTTLTTLFAHQTLTRPEAAAALTQLASGTVSEVQMAAFLTVYRMRAVTVAELAGFRDALLALGTRPDLGTTDLLDLCGTGGDGRQTFNISTTAAFVVAGAGQLVAKHGNYGVSSGVGSSDVLAGLGYHFTTDSEQLRRELAEAGICFLHAPSFQPAMRQVAPVRRALGVRTFFNMLGPLVNPAQPRAQLVGVYSLELLRLYQYLFEEKGQDYALLHALDGYDECSLTGPLKLVTPAGERLLTPADLGLPTYAPTDLTGAATGPEAAALVRRILAGQGTAAQRDVVAANAALALHAADSTRPLRHCVDAAQTALAEGRGLNALDRLLNVSRLQPEAIS